MSDFTQFPQINQRWISILCWRRSRCKWCWSSGYLIWSFDDKRTEYPLKVWLDNARTILTSSQEIRKSFLRWPWTFQQYLVVNLVDTRKEILDTFWRKNPETCEERNSLVKEEWFSKKKTQKENWQLKIQKSRREHWGTYF